MSILSINGHLTTPVLRVVLIVGIIMVCALLQYLDYKGNYSYKDKVQILRKELINNETELLLIGSMFLVVLIYMVRSFIYFDTTADALVYELPRVFQFSTSGSLFINQNAVAINIFVDEWNGELNAVFYRVLTGDNISIMFGNAEILLFGLISIWRLGKNLIGKDGYIWPLAIFSLPVTVFLSFTVKSELLAILGLPIFVFSFFLFLKERREGNFDIILLLGCIAMGALTTGARITTIPAVGMMMLILLFYLLVTKTKRMDWLKVLIASFISYVICWERFILNYIFFGNMFQRVDVPNEKVMPSLSRFVTTAKSYLFDIWNGYNIFTIENGTVWTLCQNAGLVGWIIILGSIYLLISIVLFLLKRKSNIKEYWPEVLSGFCILGSFLFLISSLDYFSWSFRYYAPFLNCIFMAIIFSLAIHKKLKPLFRFTEIIIIINLISTVGLSTRCGDVTGADLSSMLNKTEVERRFSFHPYFLSENGSGMYDEVYQYIRKNSNILVYTGINEGSSHLYGDNASNKVIYCDDTDFLELLSGNKWDAVVISQKNEEANAYMGMQTGYSKCLESELLGNTYLANDLFYRNKR